MKSLPFPYGISELLGPLSIFYSGLMSDLLWSDPHPYPGRGPSKRGVGLSFGADVTKRFLEDNNLGICHVILWLGLT